MERCAYCGHPVSDAVVTMGEEVFCTEDCMERFETGEGEIENFDKSRYEVDGSLHDY